MFIQQAFRIRHQWWLYLVGFVGSFFIIAQFLGVMPLIFAVGYKLYSEGKSILSIQDPSVLMGTLDSNLTLFLMLFAFAVGMLSLYFFVRYVHKQPFKELTTARPKVDWGRIFFGFAMITLVNGSVVALGYYSNPDDYVVQFELVPFLILALIVIIMIPIQTSFEEYLFRGYLMQGIGVNIGNRWAPLLITSVIFGGLHILNPEVGKLGYFIMVYYIGMGLFLGIITLMDDGMELALGVHAGNNMVAALLVTSDWTVFQTNSVLKDVSEPTLGFDVFIPVLVILPVYLLILSKKYGWKNWKEKLFGPVYPPEDLDENNFFKNF